MTRPERIGKYELLESLGSGGMATVYRGRDPDLQRDVAIKMLHPHLCSREESRLRFRREARAVARLKHHAVLEVYEAGEDDGRPFIVSELVLGGSLDNWAAARRPLPTEVVAAIGLRITEGLHAAHQAGIIHRDLKPGNILMGAGGQVKVADFGIAQIVDIEHLTSTGQILGSPAFMSPEHLEGARLDARADVFSFGTLLHWLATGELPFNGPNPHAVLRRVLEAEYPDPARVRPEIGEQLADVIRTCLKRRPEDRFASMADLGSALRAVLAGCGVAPAAVGELLAAFELDPGAERPTILRRREAALLERCRRLSRTRGAEAEVRRLCSWILAWEPEHREALRLVEESIRHWPPSRLTVAFGALAALAVVFGVWLALRGASDGDPATTTADALVAAALDGTAAGEAARRPDAAAGQPTTAAVDSHRPDDGGAPEAPVADAATDADRRDGPARDVPAGDGPLEEAADAATDVSEAAVAAAETTWRPPIAPPRTPRLVSFRPAPCTNVEIWIDGERLGVWGPPPGLVSTPLPPGEHQFRYRPLTVNCYDEAWTETVAAGDGPYVVTRRLRLRPGTLIVDTSGVEAQVDVRGRASGRANAPLEIPFEAQDGISPSLRVVVTFPGRPPLSRDVMVRAGETTTITVPPPPAETAAAPDSG
ncbi:MAG: serine/threonine protein kinase [Deltaproteobacteria bacterium]|nr:serine/threonine protein kinase [Deltaproteobacteria bacterium]